MSDDDVIPSICEENLNVYMASPIRLREDVGQEAEIAHDYRGRILYELLQNADDAMADNATAEMGGRQDAVFLRLTDTDLWVGNSGRPLRDIDVRGLCGIGASPKGGAVNRKRASIGHKGMGFKSVLEITAAPQIMSETFAFELGRHLAVEPVRNLMRAIGHPPPEHVPAMRFPATLGDRPPEWEHATGLGMRTLFRFPLRDDLGADQRSSLADRLLDLPVTAILFLKHLERIDVAVETSQRNDAFRWEITRNVSDEGSWTPVAGLTRNGLYQVSIAANQTDTLDFLVAHRDDLEIGTHRGGLDEYAWDGVELSEVSVAVQIEDDAPIPVDQSARVLHVFLPTAEPCPYPLVINGAFSADLSRQEVRVMPGPHDYNGWLLSEAAGVFGRHLAPALRSLGATDLQIIGLLDRGATEAREEAPTPTAEALVQAMRSAFAEVPIAPTVGGHLLPITEIVVPPLVDQPVAGSMFRSLLADDAGVDDLTFPTAELCAGRAALILADHGASVLAIAEAPRLLATADLSGVELEFHKTQLVLVDPVLRALEYMWSGLAYYELSEFQEAAQEVELFPTDGGSGQLHRVAVAERDCFYPSRALSGPIPLEGLCFLSRDLCWGDLQPSQRLDVLDTQLTAWQSIFGVREFKFPDVMRSSVLPKLTLSDNREHDAEWNSLCRTEVLAAVCQLSGRTPNADAPLPYERLKANRALFNLARLPVPCRPDESGELTWQPAYRVYLGKDWIGDASVEIITDAISAVGSAPPGVPFLASPELLVPLLERYDHLRKSMEADDDEEGDEDEEVDLDEDEEEPLDSDHRERWLTFLTWLGVNHSLRPVHFFDVEDRHQGWLTTSGLNRPSGWAFRTLDDDLWSQYCESLRANPKFERSQGGATLYFYELHDLEFLAEVLNVATKDADCSVSRALLTHLAYNWSRLERFSEVQVAAVPFDREPSRRSKPPRAQDDERVTLGDNLWLHRLRHRPFLPSSHGPKMATTVWMPSQELNRRFSSRRLDAAQLLPVVDVDGDLAVKARPISIRLGVRDVVTSSSFELDDTRTVLERIAKLFGNDSSDRVSELDRADVREIIRPVYRNLIELLRGSDADTRFPDGALAGVPLLQDDGHGNYRFAPSTETLWVERNGTRERLGNPAGLWTFVLESSPGLRLPLTRMFNVRVLEEQLRWDPEPGEDALDASELALFQIGLQRLAPFILLRLSADRAAEDLQARDAALLRRLMAALTPVRDLRVGCRLDGYSLTQLEERSAFVDTRTDTGSIRAFVTWGEASWPPSEGGAEALASALSFTLGASHFEAFLALINAPDDKARRRLLTLAGAPSDLEALAPPIAGLNDTTEEGTDKPNGELALPKEPANDTDETPAAQRESGAASGRLVTTPLYSAADLLVSGTPVTVTGSISSPQDLPMRQPGTSLGSDSSQNYGGRTDLGALDKLGMFVAMTFEVNRLLPSLPAACIFNPDLRVDQPDAYVFDISSLERIALAREYCQRFDQAMCKLISNGVNESHVGCDILTLGPTDDGIDRLIELKSSGQHARTQDMTWNEWKTAQNERFRSRFYLYLVANLRSDLPDALPFLRAVRDPYATIRAEEQVSHGTARRVVLHTEEFEHAEYLEIQVSNKS